MNRTLLISGSGIAGDDQRQEVQVPLHGKIIVDNQGKLQGVSQQECFTPFNLLPAASAAATADAFFLVSGTGTEVIARASFGGVNLKSQASTPADGDNVLLFPAASGTGGYSVMRAQTQPRFETRVAINTITAMFASFGFNENVTDADPTGTAGDGAMFVFDPTGEFTSTLTSDQRANWAIAQKVNGTDTFTATSVPVVAGVDYELVITIGEDLKPKFYINGVLVATGTALTSGDTVGAFVGLELTATPGGQKDVDVRYIRVNRLIGG